MGPSKTTLALVALLGVAAQPGWSMSAETPQAESRLALSTLMRSLSTERMLGDVARLTEPDMNGRQTGTHGDLVSATYVRKQLDPASSAASSERAQAGTGNPELVTAAVRVPRIRGDAGVELVVGEQSRRVALGSGFLPVLDSPSVDVLAAVVFVGYGIADPARGLDEYEGVDVRGRIVLFLRGVPPGYPARVAHSEKERAARERGAVAFLTSTGPIRSPYELRRGIPAGPLAYYGHPDSPGEPGLPGAWISTDAAAWLVGGGGALEAIQATINERLTPRSQALRALARLRWEADRLTGSLHNVILRHPAGEPETQPEAIVIGAHRDHFGRQSGLLFPGADDNASGTAVLLEVARALRQAGVIPTRSLVFVSFSGEEQGLWGSRLYVHEPARPLERTGAMINIDHVGVGDGRLTVGVAGLPKEVAVEAAELAGLTGKIDVYGYFPGGDHVPFREAGVPTVTVVSGGAHPHFHQPTDVAETVQPAILDAAARFVLALVWLLAYSP